MSKMIKHTWRYIIAYLRKSTDTEDKQIRSLEDQEILAIECHRGLPAEEQGYKLQKMFEARSAYKPGRPVFNEVMDMVDKGLVYAIISLDPTRLSRNPEDAGRLVQRLADGKLPYIICTNGKRYSRADTSQIFMLMIESGMSWKDSADKSVRVSITMKQKAKEGGATGPAPIGYKNFGEVRGKRRMMIDPVTAPHVKKLFMLAATGAYSLDALTAEAKKLGLRTRPTKKYPLGLPIQKTTLHHLLRNAAYKGEKNYGGVEHGKKHEALIDPTVWKKVQSELMKRCTSGARPKDISLRELFVMAGCVRCGVCEKRAMSPYKVKNGRYVMYECKNPKSKCRNCINQDKLLEQLYADLSLLVLDEGDYAFVRRTLKAVHEEECGNQIERRAEIEKQYQLVEHQIADVFVNLEEAKRNGVYAEVNARLLELRKRRDELQEALQNLHDTSQAWIDHLLGCFERVKVAYRCIQIGTPEQRLAMLKALGSNYKVKHGKLLCDWLSPFKEKIEDGGRTIWLLELDSNQQPPR